jgi:uncharacterized protein (DUF1697 family)
MPVHVSMLRGINVSGHHIIKMERLRASFESLGFANVKTYIQSGNVVFQSAKSSPAALSKKIEAMILSQFGFSIAVISRSADELESIISNSPLSGLTGIDVEKLHVAFLSESPSAPAIKKLSELTLAPDLSRCAGKEVYLYFPNGFSKSSLWKHPLDRVLSVTATTRNWKTVNTLHQMCLDCGR